MDRLMVDGVRKISQMIAEHEILVDHDIMVQNNYQKLFIITKKCHVFEKIWLFLRHIFS